MHSTEESSYYCVADFKLKLILGGKKETNNHTDVLIEDNATTLEVLVYKITATAITWAPIYQMFYMLIIMEPAAVRSNRIHRSLGTMRVSMGF